jgi:hypothetical protein
MNLKTLFNIEKDLKIPTDFNKYKLVPIKLETKDKEIFLDKNLTIICAKNYSGEVILIIFINIFYFYYKF